MEDLVVAEDRWQRVGAPAAVEDGPEDVEGAAGQHEHRRRDAWAAALAAGTADAGDDVRALARLWDRVVARPD